WLSVSGVRTDDGLLLSANAAGHGLSLCGGWKRERLAISRRLFCTNAAGHFDVGNRWLSGAAADRGKGQRPHQSSASRLLAGPRTPRANDAVHRRHDGLV